MIPYKYSKTNKVERDGTGCSTVERDGTGCSTVERDGTGISGRNFRKRARHYLFASILAILLPVGASANNLSPKNFNVHVNGNAVIVTWQIGTELYVGRSPANNDYSVVTLSRVNFDSSIFYLKAEGSGTGLTAEGSGTGISDKGTSSSTTAEGSGTGISDKGSNNSTSAEGSGTGITAEGSGTGITAEGSGTGITAEGSGTGITAEGSGTGITAEGSGTGDVITIGDIPVVIPSDGRHAFAVEVVLDCQGVGAVVYETQSFQEIGFLYTEIHGHTPQLSMGCESEDAWGGSYDAAVEFE